MTRSSYARDEGSVDVDFRSTILITNPLKDINWNPIISNRFWSYLSLSWVLTFVVRRYGRLGQLSGFSANVSQFTKCILHSTRFSQRELLNWQINDFLSNLESTSRFCAKLVSGPSWMGFTIQQVLQNYQWRNHSVQSLDSRLVSMILVLSGHPWNSHVLSVGPKKTFKTNFFF